MVAVHNLPRCVRTASDDKEPSTHPKLCPVVDPELCRSCAFGRLRLDHAPGQGTTPPSDVSNKVDGLMVPPRIAYPANLGVVGTVNVDETTFGFSPKVLDRALVIELNQVCYSQFAKMKNKSEARKALWLLEGTRQILEKLHLHPGYRVAGLLLEAEESDLDLLFAGKVLPKVRGHGQTIQQALLLLREMLHDPILDGSELEAQDWSQALPRWARRIADGDASAPGQGQSPSTAEGEGSPAGSAETQPFPVSTAKIDAMLRRYRDLGSTGYF